MPQAQVQAVLDYLKQQHLLLTTAESCTAGRMVALLAESPGTGEVLESGYVVYSPEAKKRLLGVSDITIERYGLTSEAVAWEMAMGALRDSTATVAIATTGVAGPESADGIAPGTLCFAWAFAGEPLAVFTRTQRFFGIRTEVLQQGALYGLTRLSHYHQRWLRGERA
ncbi:PncC family amidohydrolase [Pseudomonas sp. BIGb0278]|jgi:nicotinamide-nucleotide amidase|uniref:Nicotinamide-nucleotide amidohydrolase PncC n=1 Tax=Pseudomonas fluorescens TaxID=294 RepID=A0A5E6PXS7_PSEFL|nr:MULTISPECIES: CinA family protein [Pseudomonas]AUF96381.1 damage-inducible protein CinA [Pseudomonas sp. 02C 26]MCS4282812.1 PncC family amidohydrolase [Pseudomonas sp. BIGb0278]QYX53990.1 CinA family protein [Pseudomonas sp. S07E 245]VVM36910.1 Nicotinamide-nucleotide amidohydrolase PncC [Pseudomonas fluorescens]VVM48063.1 Nicotinamide-nucleotide amidohydrolase PncC [Pseudomonas fluorescens]